MTIPKIVAVFGIALAAQTGIFAWRYRDLIFLHQPASAIAKNDPQTFDANVSKAMSRSELTRRHLDTIAAAAVELGRPQVEIEALERRLAKDPRDVDVRLRLADALRRAGQLQRAEALYIAILSESGGER
jgi:thioredoxin-like negative regulator of GroEL